MEFAQGSGATRVVEDGQCVQREAPLNWGERVVQVLQPGLVCVYVSGRGTVDPFVSHSGDNPGRGHPGQGHDVVVHPFDGNVGGIPAQDVLLEGALLVISPHEVSAHRQDLREHQAQQ